jgi:hypothetical protein
MRPTEFFKFRSIRQPWLTHSEMSLLNEIERYKKEGKGLESKVIV